MAVEGVARWSRLATEWRARFTEHRVVWLVAGVWFVVAFATVLWCSGVNPPVLISPDEAVNRLASVLIHQQGRPFLRLPFADPEDLAHPRHWVSIGDYAVPAYPPVAIYFYAAFLKARAFGSYLLLAVCASGPAAFSAGAALLLPARRQALALAAPLLGFPALYWVMRPWMNIALLLVALEWGFLFWALWLRSERRHHLALAMLGAGIASALRPDYAAYLMPAFLLFAIAERPRQWKQIALWIGVAGVVAVAANLVLNLAITGNPLRAAYQIALAREDGQSAPGGILALLRQLLAPMPTPSLRTIGQSFLKYWVFMGNAGLLLVSTLALVPLAATRPSWSRALLALGVCIVIGFMLSHVADELSGSDAAHGAVHHSMPRYWTPVYLFAGLPFLCWAGGTQRRALWAAGVFAITLMAFIGAQSVYLTPPQSLSQLRQWTRNGERRLEALRASIPQNAIVYTSTADKLIWSSWYVCEFDGVEPSVASMKRALAQSRPVFMLIERPNRNQLAQLARMFRPRGIKASAADARHGLYRIELLEP